MNAISSIQRPVHWYEGMLLAPQHFQQNNLYIEQQMLHMMQRMTPYYHGLMSLYFDLQAMAEADYKLVKVSFLHAIMPDGTEVRYDEASMSLPNATVKKPLEYRVEDLDELPAMQPFYIYLAVAKLSDASGNNTDMRRYNFIKSAEISDIYDSSNKVALDNLEPHLQLLDQNQISPSYSYMPIAKLRKKYDGSIERIEYTPPSLHVSSVTERTPAGSPLWKNIAQKLALLRTKANEKREYYTKGNENAPLSNEQKQELLQINQGLPALQIMMNSQRCHPFDFYLALIKVTAGLAIFLNDGKYSDYKNYQHDELDEIFKVPLADLEQVIKQVEQPVDTLNFSRSLENQFSYQFVQPMTAEHLMLNFRCAAGVTREQLQEWVDHACICTLDKQQNVFIDRLTGASRIRVSEFAELDMKEGSDEVFYLLELDHPDFTRGGQDKQQPPLVIVGTEQKLEQFAPVAISWFKKRE